ncbi:hypothetical protein AB0G15_05450 [Streptosporangium sp. NPDC023825]|uniref:hypothetical protein n=1 Tax=Streptosporangium sp. NPDC023825 TaxID=3154909 RepID=UPI00343F5A6E
MISALSNQVDWNLRWESANIPMHLRGQTLDDWPPQSELGFKALQAARRFVDTLPQRIHTPAPGASRDDRSLIGVGMAVIGTHGSGKTDLVCATLTTAHLTHGASIGYARAAAFIAACMACDNPPKDDDERHDPTGRYQRAVRLRRRMVLASVAALDDMGKEHKTASSYVARKINNYLRYRHEIGKPTLVTSNDPIEKWAVYDPALPSFALQALPAVLLIGADLRARR